MAKLAALQDSNVIPTSVPGIFIKDLPYKEFQQIYTSIGDTKTDDQVMDAIVLLFNKLIVAEDGSKFEDALTKEDIENNLSIRMIKQIMDALPEALGTNEKQLGN